MNRFNPENNVQQKRLVKILADAANAGVDVDLAYAEVQEKIRRRAQEDRHLRESNPRYPDVLHLLGQNPDEKNRLIPPGNDHESLWVNADGEVESYIFQPYHMDLEKIRSLVEFCEKHGLTAHINAARSWHCAGKTMLVELRKLPQTPINWKEGVNQS